MRHVRCRVPESAVAGICEGGTLGPWKRFIGRRRAAASETGGRTYPYAERIWFPYYLFTIEVTSRKGAGFMQVTVESWSGAFAIFQLDEYLSDADRAEGDVFPHRRDMDACAISAREDLLHTILRQRSRMGGKPMPGEITAREPILYPLWVYYYFRRKNLLDIKVVDGATGRLIGHRTRGAILQAFLEKQSGDAEAPPDGAEIDSDASE